MVPENFITITEVPSENIQNYTTNYVQQLFKFPNITKNPSFTFINFTDNTNTSLEASPKQQKMDTIVHSQPMECNSNETTETDFNLALQDDGTLFHHTL